MGLRIGARLGPVSASVGTRGCTEALAGLFALALLAAVAVLVLAVVSVVVPMIVAALFVLYTGWWLATGRPPLRTLSPKTRSRLVRLWVFGPLAVLWLGGVFVLSEADPPATDESDGKADGVWDAHDMSVSGRYTPLVGNFAGDGADDIFWYSPGTAPDSLWVGKRGVRGSFTKLATPVDGTFRPVVGDFGGDGYDDIFWFNPRLGSDPLWVSVDGIAPFDKSRTFPTNGNSAPFVLRDFRNSAEQEFKDDIFFYGAGSSPDALWHFADSTAGTRTAIAQTVNGTFHPVVGDFDGNGAEDIVWYAPGTTPDAKWLARGTGSFTRSRLSIDGAFQPVVVPQNGRDGIFWFGTGNAPDAAWRSAATPTGFGGRPVVQHPDLTGTAVALGVDQVLVYSPNGPEVVYVDRGGYDAYKAAPYPSDATSTFRPLVGNFDGDELADIFWYEPAAPDSIWYSQSVADDRNGQTTPPRVKGGSPDSR